MIKIGLLSRILLSAGALVGGMLIVVISITAANPVLSAEINESEKQFYFGQTILPDHVMYPVLMVADRAKLESVNGEEEVYTRVMYSVRRLEATEELLKKNKKDMAYTTLTKSQKYLLQAGHTVIDDKHSDELAAYVEKALIAHNQAVELIRADFSPEYYAQVNQLMQENNAMVAQLEVYRN